jgi:hypothetical protein
MPTATTAVMERPTTDSLGRRVEPQAFLAPHRVEIFDRNGNSLARYGSQLAMARALLGRRVIVHVGDVIAILAPRHRGPA